MNSIWTTPAVAACLPGRHRQPAADLRVAVNQGNPPFEFEDRNGKLTGFEVEVIQAVAQRLNKSVEFSSMPFNMLFAAVQSGRADVALGAITITAKRLENVAFTQPIIDSNQCVAALGRSRQARGAAKGARCRRHHRHGGRDLGRPVPTGTRLQGNPPLRRQYRADDGPGLAAHRREHQRLPDHGWYIRDKPQFSIIHEVMTGDRNALMLPKASPLLDAINQKSAA